MSRRPIPISFVATSPIQYVYGPLPVHAIYSKQTEPTLSYQLEQRTIQSAKSAVTTRQDDKKQSKERKDIGSFPKTKDQKLAAKSNDREYPEAITKRRETKTRSETVEQVTGSKQQKKTCTDTRSIRTTVVEPLNLAASTTKAAASSRKNPDEPKDAANQVPKLRKNTKKTANPDEPTNNSKRSADKGKNSNQKQDKLPAKGKKPRDDKANSNKQHDHESRIDRSANHFHMSGALVQQSANSKSTSKSSFAEDLEATGGDLVAAWHKSVETTSIKSSVRASKFAVSTKLTHAAKTNSPSPPHSKSSSSSSSKPSSSGTIPSVTPSNTASTNTSTSSGHSRKPSAPQPPALPCPPQPIPVPVVYAPLRNPLFPPPLRPGTNYLFPQEHTTLHIFWHPLKLWEHNDDDDDNNDHENFDPGLLYHIFRIAIGTSVAELIRDVLSLRAQGDYVDGTRFAVTEIMEDGLGGWEKVATIEYSSPQALETLASMGWTSRRGDTLAPVWLTVHESDTS